MCNFNILLFFSPKTLRGPERGPEGGPERGPEGGVQKGGPGFVYTLRQLARVKSIVVLNRKCDLNFWSLQF